MKIFRKVQYGIIAIVSIGIYSKYDEYVSLLEIAKINNLPINYLENIMINLRINNLVLTKRGCKNSGYKLKKNPKDITLTEILNALDNTILGKNQSQNSIGILNQLIFDNINEAILEFTNNITLSMIIEHLKTY